VAHCLGSSDKTDNEPQPHIPDQDKENSQEHEELKGDLRPIGGDDGNDVPI